MNNRVVVDTSMVVKWIVTVADSDVARTLLAEWTSKDIIILAPALLVYEATNSLYKYIRAGQMPLEDAESGLNKVIFPLVTLDSPKEPSFSLRTIELNYHPNSTYQQHMTHIILHLQKEKAVSYGQQTLDCGKLFTTTSHGYIN